MNHPPCQQVQYISPGKGVEGALNRSALSSRLWCGQPVGGFDPTGEEASPHFSLVQLHYSNLKQITDTQPCRGGILFS